MDVNKLTFYDLKALVPPNPGRFWKPVLNTIKDYTLEGASLADFMGTWQSLSNFFSDELNCKLKDVIAKNLYARIQNKAAAYKNSSKEHKPRGRIKTVNENRSTRKRKSQHQHFHSPVNVSKTVKISSSALALSISVNDQVWLNNFDILQAYAREKGCTANDEQKKMKKQVQTQGFGTCTLTKEEKIYGTKLGIWCKAQRRAKQNMKKLSIDPKAMVDHLRISAERIARLESIGFEWDMDGYLWSCNYDKLRAYQKEEGCNVNDMGTKIKQTLQTKSFRTHTVEVGQPYGKKLASWCSTQRMAKQNMERLANDPGANVGPIRISDKQIAKLEGIGFEWDISAYLWSCNFDKLRAYKKEESCNVNDGISKMKQQLQTQSFGTHVANIGHPYGTLGRWCMGQKAAKKNMAKLALNAGASVGSARISDAQIARLEGIGFEWNATAYWWSRSLDKLRAYRQEEGCNVNDGVTKMNSQLQTQSFGTHIPEAGKVYAPLGEWCKTQRTRKVQSLGANLPTKIRGFCISAENVASLEGIGFAWDASAYWWSRQLDSLRAYQKEEDCDVNDGRLKMSGQTQTQSFGAHVAQIGQPYGTKLVRWCKIQRTAKQNMDRLAINPRANVDTTRISDDRIARLEGIGFSWNREAYWWSQKFDMLRAYGQEEGCTVYDGWRTMRKQIQTQSFGSHVPEPGKTYSKLGTWCSTQKTAKQNMVKLVADPDANVGNNRISDKQIASLNSIGFEW